MRRLLTTAEFSWRPFGVAMCLVAMALIPTLYGTNTHDDAHTIPRNEAMGNIPLLSSMHGLSDLLTAASFIAMALMLAYLVYDVRRLMPLSWMIGLFGASILLCGMTHAFTVVTLYHPLYWPAAFIKTLAATTSIGTAFALAPTLPKIGRLVRSMSAALDTKLELERVNQQLKTNDTLKDHRHRQVISGLMHQHQVDRKHTAHDIHDTVTQQCAAFLQTVQVHTHSLELEGQEVPPLLIRAQEEARVAVQTSRRIMNELRPKVLDDYGLHSAIQNLVQQYQDEGYNIEYSYNPPDTDQQQRPTGELETVLYRVLQEALVNIKKHSQASHAWIHLELTGRDGDSPKACLSIEDNGKGFDPTYLHPQEELARGEHIGLESMTERVNALGGTLIITSAPGKGTKIEAMVPIIEDNH